MTDDKMAFLSHFEPPPLAEKEEPRHHSLYLSSIFPLSLSLNSV